MSNRFAWIPVVVDHIERNIRGVISVETLASLANCSARHFQRLFHEAMAEGVMEYIRGRRLTLAMAEIGRGDRKILDIALDFGFESQEAFARSFQARFAFPPRRFHRNGLVNHPAEKPVVSEEYLQLIRSRSLTLEPKIFRLEPQVFIGLASTLPINSHSTDGGFSQTGAAITRFRARLCDLAGSDRALHIAPLTLVSYRVPARERQGGDGVITLVALKAEHFDGVPEGMARIESPGGEYVAFAYSGPPIGVMLTTRYIMGSWFPRSDFWFGNGPTLSDLRITSGGTHLEATFLLPLRRRNPRLKDPWWE